MPNDRGRSKRLAKQKAKRAEVKKKQTRAEAARSPHALLRRAAEFPIDKTYLSEEWRESDPDLPSLVTAMMVRRRGAIILVGWALVDRACLGIKNAFTRVVSEQELSLLLRRATEIHAGVEQVDLLTWQSVVFHAVDFARSLGFEPHPDLPLSFLGPRPDSLLDTPMARPPRPVYAAGPDDDVPAILTKLAKARGTDYRAILSPDPDHPVVVDPLQGAMLEPLFGDDEDDEDDEDDSGELTPPRPERE